MLPGELRLIAAVDADKCPGTGGGLPCARGTLEYDDVGAPLTPPPPETTNASDLLPPADGEPSLPPPPWRLLLRLLRRRCRLPLPARLEDDPPFELDWGGGRC